MTLKPTQVQHEENVEAPAERAVLDFDNVLTFRAGDATPSVKSLRKFRTAGTSVTITDFDDGQQGHVIYVLGDGDTTVAHNANIRRTRGISEILKSEIVYSFIHIDGVWHEIVDRYGVIVALDGTAVNTIPRRIVNFVQGTGIEIDVIDDGANDRVDVEIRLA